LELKINYQLNDCGLMLFEKIKAIFENAKYDHVDINGEEHINISLNKEINGPVRVINTRRAIENTQDSEKYCSILNINSIACNSQVEESVIKTYEVLLWGFACISVKVWAGASERGKTKTLRERDNQKVVDQARRIVYFLGLDLAVVTIAYTARRRYKALSINPSPALSEKNIDLIVQKITDLSSQDQRVMQKDIKMGADPEFMMFNSRTGKIVSASNHFPREGMVGCDNIRMPNRTQRPVAEVRPRPDYSPIILTANIKQALHMANQMAPYRGVRWAAGSQPGGGFSIGGHIHFSNIKVNASILRALDNFVGLPIFLIENPVPASRRRKRYGRLGDYRNKEYGGFEYRTPASWLVSQNITLAILCLAKIVISRYPWLPYNYLNTSEAQQAFYQGNKDYFYPIVERLWSHLEKIDMFEEYRIHLNELHEMLVTQSSWNETGDFRKAWMIPAGSRKRSARESDDESKRVMGTPAYSATPTVRTRSAGRPRSSGSSEPGTGRVITSHQVRRNHRVR
jgi:hypothetical protein